MDQTTFQWAIVGAGPAGIAAVGKLLDYGVEPTKILWLDPHFKVGDLGHYWQTVSSNTTVKLFLQFLHAVDSFAYKQSSHDFKLNHLPKDSTCMLHYIVEPLQWITNELSQKVHTVHAKIHNMELSQRLWALQSDTQSYFAQNVILATGAVPESLNYPGVEVMPFDLAIDQERLTQSVNLNETYGVFGSSHSAIIIINNLVELGVKKVINFYRSPCRYAVNMGDWILFDNTGLKGHTAKWARDHIDGILPPNLVRHLNNETNISRHLPECDKVIYAVGFKRRNNITIKDYEQIHYNPHVGIIGPGLFGLGIAYPELVTDPFGSQEFNVGLWKFMVYLNKVMPLWFKYPS